ncbi:MAG TPA: hypothetical protein VJ302_36620 [Blastocatellia bacterium]|nr:hypothetical protein [Blastocatellia bacterium]
MDKLNQQSGQTRINVRESKFILKSEVLDEIRPWYLENRSEDTDNDGSDKNDE